MLKICSGRLCVEVDEPGTTYAGSRFDWSAFITQVTLDGVHRFCVPEARDGTGTGGIGLCAEFGITRPVAFDAVPPGGEFPKLGIGRLRRTDGKAYDFFRPYHVNPAPVDVEGTEGRLTFRTTHAECAGIAARIEKVLTICANELRIDTRLENTGAATIATDEYVHNFIAVDALPFGPDYSLELSESLDFEGLDPSLAPEERRIGWRTPPVAKSYFRGQALPAQTGRFVWTLRHASSGCSIRETVTGPCSRFHLYGTLDLVSPEVFVDIHLAPGEAQSWQRVYRFE